MDLLKWVRSSNSAQYHLLGKNGMVGSLIWVGGSHDVAVAEIGARILVFRKTGFFRPHISVETVREMSVGRINLDGKEHAGSFHLSDGRQFDFLADEYLEWKDGEKQTLARVACGRSSDGMSISAEYERKGEDLPLLLLAAGLYIQRSRNVVG